MLRRPNNIVRRFAHRHKSSYEIDCATWYKSENFKVKIDNMSNKIDEIHVITRTTAIAVMGSIVGTGLGLMIPIVIGIFK
jgi:hypothetical protein